MDTNMESTLDHAMPSEEKFYTKPSWFSMKYAENDMKEQEISIRYVRMYRDYVEVYYYKTSEKDEVLSNILHSKTISESLFDCGGILNEYNYLETQSDDLSLKLYKLDIDFEDKYDPKFKFHYKLSQRFPDIGWVEKEDSDLAYNLKIYGVSIIQEWARRASVYGHDSEFADMLFLDSTIRWCVLGVC